jgi:hypothetical protein
VEEIITTEEVCAMVSEASKEGDLNKILMKT